MPSEPNDFLSSYFYGLSQAQQQRQFDATKALESRRLQFQMQEHNDTMAQHAKEYNSEQDYKNALLQISQHREEREHANQVRDDLEKFQEKGGYFMPKPTDKTETSSIPSFKPDLSVFGASAPPATQPVGPSPLMGQLGGGQVLANPPQMPAIPQQFQASVPAAMQMPDPNVARQSPAMEGQPADTIAMRTTPQEQAKQDILAKYSAKHEDDIPVPQQFQEWFGGGLPQKMAPADIFKMGELRVADLDRRAGREENNAIKVQLASQADDTKRFLGVMANAIKEKGAGDIEGKVKTVVDDPVGSGQSFYNLTPKSREAAMTEFNKYGLGVPRKLSSQAINQQDAANQMLSFSNKILDQIHDPDMQHFFGAVPGRVALMALEKVGDIPIADSVAKTPEAKAAVKEKLARLQGNLNIFKLMETRAALPGGRLLSSVLEQMGNSTARMSTALPIMEGHILGSKDNARAVLEGIEDGVGKGWKDRTSFQDSLHSKLQDLHPVTGVPKEQADAMPLNQVVTIKGHKFLKKEVFRTGGDVEHGEVNAQGPGQVQVFKVD